MPWTLFSARRATVPCTNTPQRSARQVLKEVHDIVDISATTHQESNSVEGHPAEKKKKKTRTTKELMTGATRVEMASPPVVLTRNAEKSSLADE